MSAVSRGDHMMQPLHLEPVCRDDCSTKGRHIAQVDHRSQVVGINGAPDDAEHVGLDVQDIDLVGCGPQRLRGVAGASA